MELTRVTASGLVYLFGEEFAKPWTPWHDLSGCLRALVDLVVFAGTRSAATDYTRSRPPPERLAYSGERVHRGELVTRLFEAAFVSLAREGYISLETRRLSPVGSLRKSLRVLSSHGPLRDEVTITQEKEVDDLPPSLERAIVNALSGDPKKDSVQAVVDRLTGPTYHKVLGCVKKGLVEAGVMRREVEKHRYLPNRVDWSAREEVIAPLAREVDALKASLETFADINPHLHTRLILAIDAGCR